MENKFTKREIVWMVLLILTFLTLLVTFAAFLNQKLVAEQMKIDSDYNWNLYFNSLVDKLPVDWQCKYENGTAWIEVNGVKRRD